MNNKKDQTINQTISLKIPCSSNYDWEYFLSFQSKRLIETIEAIQGKVYKHSIRINNINGDFEIKPYSNTLVINLSKSFLPVLPYALKRISSILDVETNTDLIGTRFQKLYPYIHIKSGLHIPGVSSPYEAGIRAICSQQVSIAAAKKLLNQFVTIFSNTDFFGNHYFHHPSKMTKLGLEKMKMMQSKKYATPFLSMVL